MMLLINFWVTSFKIPNWFRNISERERFYFWFSCCVYKCHKINFKHGDSYIHYPDWIKKKAIINPKNKDDKCFQFAATVALNHEEITKEPQKISKIKPLINKYNWNGIKYPLKADDWKTFEKYNLIIALNIFHIKEKEIYPAYISKYNSTCEKKRILLMIPNEKKKDGVILQ